MTSPLVIASAAICHCETPLTTNHESRYLMKGSWQSAF